MILMRRDMQNALPTFLTLAFYLLQNGKLQNPPCANCYQSVSLENYTQLNEKTENQKNFSYETCKKCSGSIER